MKIALTHTLEHKGLFLRSPSESDIPHIFSATRFEGFNDGMLWEPPANEEELLENHKNSISAWEMGEGYTFSIVEKESKKLLGRISIRKTKELQKWDVGFWTHPNVQGKGIMTNALKAVLKFGFEELGAQKIEACHAIWNKGSEKVLRRNGMQFVCYLEEGYQKKGEWVAENLLEITATEWNNRNSDS